MKKSLLLMLIAIMVLVSGCGGGATTEPAAEEGIKIGYSCSNLNDTGQTYIVAGAKEYADANGITIDVQDAQEDEVKQQDQVKAMIEQGVDALIVVPVITDAMGPITDAAKEAGIPLVYVNRNPFKDAEIPEGVYYVGSYDIVAGRLQAEELVKVAGEKFNVAILMGILSNEGAVSRTEGNNEVFAKYPGIKVLAQETGNWQRDQGMSLTENWLTAYGADLNAIVANNDEMALGAIQALTAAGRTDVIVMGIDAIPDAIAAIEAGTMKASILQDLHGQGKAAAELSKQIIDGATPAEQAVWLDFVPVTPENYKDFK